MKRVFLIIWMIIRKWPFILLLSMRLCIPSILSGILLFEVYKLLISSSLIWTFGHQVFSYYYDYDLFRYFIRILSLSTSSYSIRWSFSYYSTCIWIQGANRAEYHFVSRLCLEVFLLLLWLIEYRYVDVLPKTKDELKSCLEKEKCAPFRVAIRTHVYIWILPVIDYRVIIMISG